MAEMIFKKIKEKTEKESLTNLYFVYSDEVSKKTVEQISEKVNESLKFSKEHIYILPLTLVVGAHTGPGSFGAIFY